MPLIRFETKLFEINSWTILRLPESASAGLPSRGMTMVSGIINGAPFRAVLEPDGRYAPGQKSSHWFSPDQIKLFTYPDAGETANSGRNSFIGPEYTDLDVMLQKRFLVRENRGLQLRVEAFNVQNHVQFANPDSNLYDTNFGLVSSTQGSSRKIQVGLKYQF